MVSAEELFHYLNDEQQKLGPIRVSKYWREYADNMALKFLESETKSGVKSNRTWEDRQIDADALLIEVTHWKTGIAEKPEHKSHDEIALGAKLDNKLIENYFNINTISKMKWYRLGIATGQLDYFAFYRYANGLRFKRPLQYGDAVEYNLINVVPAATVLNNVRPSQYPNCEYYYNVQKYKSMVELV